MAEPAAEMGMTAQGAPPMMPDGADQDMAAPADAGGIFGQPQQASAEEQQAYTEFVSQAFSVIYDEAFFPKVLQMLEGSGDPIEGLARTTALVVARVAQSADQAGQKPTGDVLLHAGKEIFEDLAMVATKAKIKDFETDEDAMESAFLRAMDQFRVMLQGAGRINPDAAKGDLAKLQEMDQRGELETAFRNMAQEDSKGREAAPEESDDDEEEAPPKGLKAAAGMHKMPNGKMMRDDEMREKA